MCDVEVVAALQIEQDQGAANHGHQLTIDRGVDRYHRHSGNDVLVPEFWGHSVRRAFQVRSPSAFIVGVGFRTADAVLYACYSGAQLPPASTADCRR